MRFKTPQTASYTWQTILACIWVAFVSAADLKLSVHFIHWYFTAVVLMLLSTGILRARYSAPVKFTMLGGGLLVLSIAIVAPTTSDLVYQLEEAAKLGIMLLVVAPVLLARADTSRGLRLGAEFALAVNGALVIAGALGVGGILDLRAAGRYGTFLNGPGSLWRVGIMVLVPSALNLLLGRSFFWPLAMFTGSVAVLVFDGSRTAGLAILAAVGFVIYFIMKEMRRSRFASRRLLWRVASLGIVLLAGVAWRPVQEAYVQNVSFGERLSSIFDAAESNGVAGVEAEDRVRVDMLDESVAAIVEHPLIGTGMGTTAIVTVAGPMVVHNAYLQAWADIGILGVASLVFLTIGILLGPWARLSRVALPDVGDRISFYNGVYLLTCWAFSGLLHPLSTEISEWVMFIVGLAGLQVAFFRPSRPAQPAVRFSASDGSRLEMQPASLRP